MTFADMAQAGRNPGRIIPRVLLAFAAANAGRRVSIIGEPIWPGRTDVEYPACVAHEALINAVFMGRNAGILCPYDASRLDENALDDAWRTHPAMIVGGARRRSPRYTDPLATAVRAQVNDERSGSVSEPGRLTAALRRGQPLDGPAAARDRSRRAMVNRRPDPLAQRVGLPTLRGRGLGVPAMLTASIRPRGTEVAP